MRRSPLKTPYSFTFSPRSRAIARRRMLCAFEPVKYWSAAPNDSGGTTRRSTCTPESITMLAFVPPAPRTRRTSGSFVNAPMILPASAPAARMSMSPIVSRMRRRLPAATAPLTPRSSSCATIFSTSGSASPSSIRRLLALANSTALRNLSAFFAPMPGTPASFPLRAASANSSTVLMPSFSWTSAAVRGPTPGISIIRRTPGGTPFIASSSFSILPVVIAWTIFFSMPSPMPGSSRSRFSRTSAATSSVRSRRTRAALR